MINDKYFKLPIEYLSDKQEIKEQIDMIKPKMKM